MIIGPMVGNNKEMYQLLVKAKEPPQQWQNASAFFFGYKEIVYVRASTPELAAEGWINFWDSLSKQMISPITVSEILAQAAELFDERNEIYKDAYKEIGPSMMALFPNGAPRI